MGYDRKYGKVTTEFGTIGDDEPVVVFRAQDITLPNILAYYMLRCVKAGSPQRHINIIFNTLQYVKNWQRQNVSKVKVPTSESSRDRMND